MANQRDFLEYSIQINRAASNTAKDFMRTSGSIEKFTNEYKDPSNSTISPIKHKRDLNGSPLINAAKDVQLRPLLIENGFADNPKYHKLPANFKRLFVNEYSDSAMKLPIVGYAGHRKGEKAENMYAKNYRECTMQACKNLR